MQTLCLPNSVPFPYNHATRLKSYREWRKGMHETVLHRMQRGHQQHIQCLRDLQTKHDAATSGQGVLVTDSDCCVAYCYQGAW